MKFMMFVCVDGSRMADEPEPNTDEAPADGSFPWLDDVVSRGIRLDGDQLRPPSQARTVQVRNGEILISDGPFAETKDVIIGYDVLDCADIDEALAVAAKHPVAEVGRIEVRQFMWA